MVRASNKICTRFYATSQIRGRRFGPVAAARVRDFINGNDVKLFDVKTVNYYLSSYVPFRHFFLAPANSVQNGFFFW